jgi:adenine phosphoribosyltransferase
MSEIAQVLKSTIRDVHDFPKKGIVFKDISPLFQDVTAVKKTLEALVGQVKDLRPDVVIGVDSRGFLFGNSLAMALGVPFVMARKKGKLPFDKVSKTYELEYGSGEIEMHQDSFVQGAKVLVHDDLLATGGTGACVGELVKLLGGEVVAFSFIVNLSFLNGKEVLEKSCSKVLSLVDYEE